MSKQILTDARQAHKAYQECPSGSYVENALAHAIARDILPALIHACERTLHPVGFTTEDSREIEEEEA